MNVFDNYYQMVIEKIDQLMDNVRDILDGTKKREVTNWWLNYIEEQADKVIIGQNESYLGDIFLFIGRSSFLADCIFHH